jgi:hypothetical protein
MRFSIRLARLDLWVNTGQYSVPIFPFHSLDFFYDLIQWQYVISHLN